MIARISSGKSPAGAVLYNENKIEKGEAARLSVRNFEGLIVPFDELSAPIIASVFECRMALNQVIKQPTFHVSLALAKGELVSSDDLLAIADQYMMGMEYGCQPYAVYEHFDTEHTHIHIVSVRIDEAGRKIPDRFERERSNTLRQQIELDFGLKIAEEIAMRPRPSGLKAVEYGNGNLKDDISAIVQGVLRDFTFSSFAQFNQLLSRYNVRAVEIGKNSQTVGLAYSTLDQSGNQVGAAITASSLPYRPTRETVERRINAGAKIKGDQAARQRAFIGNQLNESNNWLEFRQKLSEIDIEIIPTLIKEGDLTGISYLDTKRLTIYTGPELGKAFAAETLRNTLGDYHLGNRVGEPRQRKLSASFSPTDGQLPVPASGIRPVEPGISNRSADLGPKDDLTGPSPFRHLLSAISEDTSLNESEEELKRMIKKSRKPRL
jgi:hypothetical protein